MNRFTEFDAATAFDELEEFEAFEEEFSYVGIPPPVLDALRARNERAAIERAVAAGFRDENTLTDLVFFARHPERHGAPLRRDEAGYSQLAAEWLAIRDRLVRAAPRQPDRPVGPWPLVAPPPAAAPPATGPGLGAGGFITVSSRAQLTPQIQTVVQALERHFRSANLKVTLTSGYRPPQDQLRLIREQAIRRGLDRQYPSITRATVENVESWLGAWDDLLHRQKYVINPPVPACSRIIQKCYSASPHSSGLAFDLSGADLDRIAAVVQGYCRQGGPLRQILVERTNNAVHVGIDAGGRSSGCEVTFR